MSVVVSTLIADSFAELNVVQPGELVPAPLALLARRRLRLLLNLWNGIREAVWAEVFVAGTLVPNLSPHTIGPSGATFTQVIRPVTLDGCDLILNTSTPNDFIPIDVINWQQYQTLSVPGIATSIPLAVYYETDWPNGKLFFYPIPDQAYGVRFAIRTLLDDTVELTDTLSMPPGYELAVTLTLAEHLATALGREAQAKTQQLAREARAVIFSNNLVVPILDLQDGQQRSTKTNFNYHSRSFS